MSKKPKSLPITPTNLEYIYGKDWSFFLEKIIPNCWCGNCKSTVSIRDYTAELNDLDDVIIRGSCATCGQPVNRYQETGEVPAYLPRIEKVRGKQLKKSQIALGFSDHAS